MDIELNVKSKDLPQEWLEDQLRPFGWLWKALIAF